MWHMMLAQDHTSSLKLRLSPVAFSYSSMVRLRVVFGMSPFRFPSWIQVDAVLLVDH